MTLSLPRLGRPVSWPRPPAQRLAGPWARNETLAGLQRLGGLSGTLGPESLAIGPDNSLYSGFEDGRIARFDGRGNLLRTIANTRGRPLGLRFHPDGSLLVCDARRGLLRVSLAGKVEVVSEAAEGLRFGFADDLDIDREGRYAYFSDASSKWHFNEDHLDLIEHGGHGRLLRCDLGSGETTVLMRGLQFANGVTLGPDDAWLLVTETGQYRIHRYWLKGPRAGQHEVWADNLPGFPDNIRFNGQDRFWLAIPVPRNPLLDWLAPHPLLRFGVLQYARHLPMPHAHAGVVLGLDAEGKTIANLQCHGRRDYHFITQVLEAGPWLYCSSLRQKTLARLPLAATGLTPRQA
ncbi:MAG: Lactonohydrolase family enzyme [Moraxellaceae bacterium]|jgi:sugar lactone lactonase YvrE|nr:Lactonohydrolase family enzyme [Moraxellaceae bacterium]